jgi:hypothetical protein
MQSVSHCHPGQVCWSLACLWASEQSTLKGMTLLLQANNLTNESYRTYAGTKDRPLENIEWGRTYLVGVSYKF